MRLENHFVTTVACSLPSSTNHLNKSFWGFSTSNVCQRKTNRGPESNFFFLRELKTWIRVKCYKNLHQLSPIPFLFLHFSSLLSQLETKKNVSFLLYNFRPLHCHSIPSSPFHVLLTFLSKFFSAFPRGTFFLSVSVSYLDLEEVYLPFYVGFPTNATLGKQMIRTENFINHLRDFHPLRLMISIILQWLRSPTSSLFSKRSIRINKF